MPEQVPVAAIPALQLLAPFKINSEALTPERTASEQEVIAFPEFRTVKLLATPEEPTTTLPRLTGPTGSNLMIPEERSGEILLQPTKIN
jgi:hypothetical protein